MLGYIVWDVQPWIIKFDSFELRYYSLMFGLGFILGYYIMDRFFKREGVAPEYLDKLTLYVILATIFGARFGHCLFYEPANYLSQPWKIILPFEGWIGNDFRFTGYQGLASHGGAIGLFLGLYLYSRKFKVKYLWILDRVAIVTALAGFFIRVGNLFNSEIYGVQTDLPWGFKFMMEHVYQRIPVDQIVPKHPTQLYEAFAYLLIFGILFYLYKTRYSTLKHGYFTGLFLVLIFASRFLIEFVKEDQETFEQGMVLNMGQILSLPFIAIGIFLLMRKAVPSSLFATTGGNKKK